MSVQTGNSQVKHVLKQWVTAGLLSLQASLSLASDIPKAVTHVEFPTPGATSVLLGRDLFYDPILSGNGNISCATCHHPGFGSGDAMSLSIGEGGMGLGPERIARPDTMPLARIPRNAPPLYNLGAYEFTTMFYDGRVQTDPDARFGIRMPAGFALERTVTSPLAAQAILPIMSHDEMAGQPGENPLADAIAAGKIRGPGGAWQMVAARVSSVPDYKQRFEWIYGARDPIHITQIGQAIADFIAFEFRSTNSPFDAFLNGDDSALTNDQLRGMSLFYGKAQCSSCHSGAFQTDHRFYSIGIPQLGPGKGHGPDYADHGRGAITGDAQDAYRFRTPSLRNVTLTAPYGHSGAYSQLEDIVRHHLDPLTMLAEYSIEKARLHDISFGTPDAQALEDFDEMLNIAIAVEIEPVALDDAEIAAILSFLQSLEDPIARTGRLGIPDAVPSGLPLDPRPASAAAPS